MTLPTENFLFLCKILRKRSNSSEWRWSSVSVKTADCDGIAHNLYWPHSFAYSYYTVAIGSGVLN
jgi:hypothetical protein